MGTSDIIDRARDLIEEARNENKLQEVINGMERRAYFGTKPNGFYLFLSHNDMQFWYQWEVWTSANTRSIITKRFHGYESARHYFDALVQKHGLKLEPPEPAEGK